MSRVIEDNAWAGRDWVNAMKVYRSSTSKVEALYRLVRVSAYIERQVRRREGVEFDRVLGRVG